MAQDEKFKGDPLLEPQALEGLRIAVSVSNSPDLARLGLHETHFKLALGEIARSVLVAGGKLAYGGHLQPDGYTAFLVGELQRYSRRDRPLRICLPASEHGKLTDAQLHDAAAELGLFGEIVCLSADGEPIAFIANRTFDPDDAPRALSGLRHYMTAETQGRIIIGGKRSGFQGTMPGVVEEALFALEAGQPLYVAGGFGGAAIDIVGAINTEAAAWFVPQDGAERDGRLDDALGIIRSLTEGRGWAALNNGLSYDENARLAATPRPSEIAALVGLGMGRRFAA